METFTRVHVANCKRITLEIVKIDHDWKIKLISQEKAGMCSTTVGFHADSLEKAKELADGLVTRDHACGGQCSEWVRVQSAGRA
jgi:hypothetical protein